MSTTETVTDSSSSQAVADHPTRYTVTVRGRNIVPSHHSFSSLEDAERFAEEYGRRIRGAFLLIEDSHGHGKLWEFLDTETSSERPNS